MSRVKVLLADSNELIRSGLRAIFEKREEMEVVGETQTGEELKMFIRNNEVDVVVIDHTAEGLSIDVIPALLQEYPSLKFVAVTFDRSGLAIRTALRSGILSYVKKDCSANEIVESVLDTAHGKRFFCGKILEVIAKSAIDVEDIEREELDCTAVTLSQREMEIIRLIAEGFTNAQIAEQLFLSDHTVTTHRKNIMKKLGVKNTAGIVMYAVKTELISPNRFLFPSEE